MQTTIPVAKISGTVKMLNYRYSEDRILQEIQAYINKTYAQHYSRNKFQASEFIFDNGHGVGFTIGNIMKYAQRYGKKNGHNRDDILKIIHYAIMLLHVHDMYNDNLPITEEQ